MISEEFLINLFCVGGFLFLLSYLILTNKYVVKFDKIFSFKFKEITKNLPKPIEKFTVCLHSINDIINGYGLNKGPILINAYFYNKCIIFKLLFSGATIVNYDQITIEKDWYPNFFGQILSVKTEKGNFSIYLFPNQIKKIQKIIANCC